VERKKKKKKQQKEWKVFIDNLFLYFISTDHLCWLQIRRSCLGTIRRKSQYPQTVDYLPNNENIVALYCINSSRPEHGDALTTQWPLVTASLCFILPLIILQNNWAFFFFASSKHRSRILVRKIKNNNAHCYSNSLSNCWKWGQSW